jgi:uncharacterized protein YaeQ
MLRVWWQANKMTPKKYTKLLCSILYMNQSKMRQATAYTDRETGKFYVLIINEALHMGDTLHSSYLNPNQMHCHGLIV